MSGPLHENMSNMFGNQVRMFVSKNFRKHLEFDPTSCLDLLLGVLKESVNVISLAYFGAQGNA